MYETSDSPKIGKIINSADVPVGILPAHAVFIDKGSPWENPFRVGIHGDQHEVIRKYEMALAHSPETLESIDHLKGKDLITYDDRVPSHGHVLLKLAAMPYRERLNWAEEIRHQNVALAA